MARPTHKNSGIIDRVERRGDTFDVGYDGHGFGLSAKHGVTPKVGDTIVVHTVNGWNVRGVDINGKQVFWQTDHEIEVEAQRRAEESDAKKKAEFEAERDDLDRRFDALPAIFQERIRLRREQNPEFRWRFEGYELFCCEQAVVVAETALSAVAGRDREKAAEWVCGWSMVHSKEMPGEGDVDSEPDDWPGWAPLRRRRKDYDYEMERELVPGWSDQHSGNTAGCARTLAVLYLKRPEDVPRMYGALAPLVGSQAYGDPIPDGA